MGRVKSISRLTKGRYGNLVLRKERLLKPFLCTKFYPRVKLYKDNDGEWITIGIHRLVAAAFIGPRPDGYHTCHNDGNPANPTLENLRYDTPKGNLADRVRHGTLAYGENSGVAVLTEELVREIRVLAASGMSQRKIAATIGHKRSTIRAVLEGKSWSWLV
jgi:hypothetical protein